MQVILIRSLANRGDLGAVLAVIERTIAIARLPDATRRQLEGTRAFLLAQAGQPPPAAELDAMMARFTAAGDQDAQACWPPSPCAPSCPATRTGRWSSSGTARS